MSYMLSKYLVYAFLNLRLFEIYLKHPNNATLLTLLKDSALRGSFGASGNSWTLCRSCIVTSIDLKYILLPLLFYFSIIVLKTKQQNAEI